MLSTLRLIAAGWRIIVRELTRLVGLLFVCLRRALARRDHKDGSGTAPPRKYRDVCCADFPWHIRARPEPFIYSQQWLSSRGLAVTWDNPDFRLIDLESSLPVGRFDLKANHRYRIEATIHNNSFMAAINTAVHFRVMRFGVGTTMIDDLGADVIDVPGAGVAIASREWLTPATAGHNCLQALIHHHDDANPLNNLGQHNTDIAQPASPTRRLRFHVGNPGVARKRYALTLDGYRLPEHSECAENWRVRQTLDYLRQLQKRHGRENFPVPAFLNATLTHTQLELDPGAEIEITLELDPPVAGRGAQVVNVSVHEGPRLVGGVTAYVEEV
jgi:hypothetical protein